MKSEAKIIKLQCLSFGDEPITTRLFRCPYWDLLPPLSTSEREELKASIREYRMKTPIITLTESEEEQVYTVLDGWHRLSIAEELGLTADDVPQEIIGDLDDYDQEQLDALAGELNLRRRHLTPEARAEWVLRLKKGGNKSNRQIADQLGIDEKTVRNDLKAAVAAGAEYSAPEKVTGADGKEYPSTQPPREATPTQQDLILSQTSPPKNPAPKCGRDDCTRRAFADGKHCTEHTLLITSPAESSNQAMSMYDQAEAKYAKPREDRTGPVYQSDLGAELVSHSSPSEEAKAEESLVQVEETKDHEPTQTQDQEEDAVRAPALHPGQEPSLLEPHLPERSELGSSVLAPLVKDPDDATAAVAGGSTGHTPGSDTPPDSSMVGGSTQSEVAARISPTGGVESSTPQKNGSDYQHGNTPVWLRDLIREIAPIALDPCHNEHSILGAILTLTKEQDGLSSSHSWTVLSQGKGLVYVNPDYADVPPWALRSIAEAHGGAEIVLCLPSSHSTAWYKLLRNRCQLLIQLGRKVEFGLKGVFGSTAKHETSLFYFGPQAAKVRAIMERDGHWVASCAEYIAPTTDPRQPGLPETVTPKEEEGEPGTWLSRALAQMATCANQTDYEFEYDKILNSCVSDEEREAFRKAQGEVQAKRKDRDVKPEKGQNEEAWSEEEIYRRLDACPTKEECRALLARIKDDPRTLLSIEIASKKGTVRARKLTLTETPKIYPIHPDEHAVWLSDERFRVRIVNWAALGALQLKWCYSEKRALTIYDGMVDCTRTEAEAARARQLLTDWRAKEQTWAHRLRKELSACNTVQEGQNAHERLSAEVEDSEEKTELKKILNHWKETKPATKPYNHKPKAEKPITSPLKKAPKPSRVKGKNEEKVSPKKARSK